jgi:hypothetical protein
MDLVEGKKSDSFLRDLQEMKFESILFDAPSILSKMQLQEKMLKDKYYQHFNFFFQKHVNEILQNSKV